MTVFTQGSLFNQEFCEKLQENSRNFVIILYLCCGFMLHYDIQYIEYDSIKKNYHLRWTST